MKKKICILLGILFLVSLSFVSAVPPVTTVQEFPNGYTIVEAQQPVLKAGENHTYYFFLYNSSDGKQVDNTTVECKFYMADETGEIVIEGASTQQPNGYWRREISGDKLEDVGFYSYGVNCQDGNGGALAGTFEVTINGKEFNTQTAISYLGFIIIFLLIFGMTLYGAIRIPWNHKKDSNNVILQPNNFRYVKIFLFSMSYMLMMFLFGLSYKFFNEAGIEGFNNFFYWGYTIFESLLYPLLIVTIIIFVIIFLSNQKLKKKIKLGIE